MGENSQRSVQPKLLPVDFRSQQVMPRPIDTDSLLIGIAQPN